MHSMNFLSQATARAATPSIGWWQQIVIDWTAMPESLRTIAVGLVAGALGFLLSMFSNFLANRHARKLQAQTFEFEQSQRQEERHQQLRREVYLPAAEAAVATLTVFGKTADVAIDDSDIQKIIQPFSIAVAQVQLVGGPETVRAVSAAQRAILKAFIECMGERIPLKGRHAAIQIADRMHKQHQADLDRWLEMMRQYNLEGTRDNAKWAAIQEQNKFSEQQRDEVWREWQTLTRLQVQEILAIVRGAPARLAPIYKALNPALVAMRVELKMDPAREMLEQELQKNLAETTASLESFVSTLELQLQVIEGAGGGHQDEA
jgi:hypothetical protein